MDDIFKLGPSGWVELAGLAGIGTLAAAAAGWQRLQLSLAKQTGLVGHTRWAKRLARWLPGYSLGEAAFFACDDAPTDVVRSRREGFQALCKTLNDRHARTITVTQGLRSAIADLAFTSAYRVPFPFSTHLRSRLQVGAVVRHAEGHLIEDMDGAALVDLTGSYGVNLFGHDFYRACLDEAHREAGHSATVLGAYHPCVGEVVSALQRISRLPAVSFHMSGTEAVMQAVRLARYHTHRPKLVRFAGAYHGWWDDVQPGPGTPLPPCHTLTLREGSDRSLDVLRNRRDIACVLVNPLQALHPNCAAPTDGTLVDGSRQASFDRAAYTEWLQRLRRVCDERGIALILDEVFVGFRLAKGGAQEYFKVQADLVTYGKTLAGGLPIGVVCGRAEWMRRSREDRPADICFARGTFNAHPLVMAGAAAFLRRLEHADIRSLYAQSDAIWRQRAHDMNTALAAAQVPVRVAAMGTIWTVNYTTASRYHWMLQFYLRQHGLALSWTGTGRLIFNLGMGDTEFDQVVHAFVAAAQDMQAHQWWWQAPGTTHASLRKRMAMEMWHLGWRKRASLPGPSGDRPPQHQPQHQPPQHLPEPMRPAPVVSSRGTAD